jgi:hypothetical protein
LTLTEGTRIIRILGDEVQVKRLWFEVNELDKKTQAIRKAKKPFTVAVFDGDRFVGDKGMSFYTNPLSAWYEEQYAVGEISEEHYKKLYPQTRFFVNVFDRTPVILDEQHNPVYPDKHGKYRIAGTPVPHNKVLILEGSAGKQGGKHLLQQMITVGENLRSFTTGQSISLMESDLRIITTGSNITTTRVVMPDANQSPIPREQIAEQFDLVSWLVPFPYDGLQELVEGAEYTDVVARYNVQLYPKKVRVL